MRHPLLLVPAKSRAFIETLVAVSIFFMGIGVTVLAAAFFWHLGMLSWGL